AKLNDVEPLGYLIDVLTKIVNGNPNSQIDTLLPWTYPSEHNLSRKMKASR
ncbi:transposase domain-containing protein, partial [Rhizobium sp. Nf11,1]|uniref:transposase domain-containing protein n=1 Tax=Rhizobium sp. Nf11,1 TaxID=3404923 RepID=UPI003D356935